MAENTEPDADNKSPEGAAASQRRAYGVNRRAAPAPDAEPPDGLEEKLADLVDSVKGLQSHLAGSRPISESPSPAETRPRGPKRFQRRGGEELPEPEVRPEVREPVLDHEVRGNEATLNKNIAWPRLARVEPAPASFGERATAYLQRHSFIIWLLVQATGLGLILLGYWVGSSLSGDDEDRTAKSDDHPAAASRPPVADLLARVGINDRALGAVNNALRAEKDGNFDAARQTYEEASAGRVRLPGSEYRLAMLDIERQDFASADIHLNNSLTAGEMMTSCYFVNACFAAKKGDFNEVAKQLAHTVRLEPFSSKYLFCYGEALRRSGKTQAAVETLGQALDRPGAPPDMELIEFKQRLAKVELGQDEAFNKELADHLAKTPVGGDWLLLAAAQDLSHAAYPAAAAHLADAAKVLSPHAYSVLIQDYLYQGYAGHAELAPVLKVSPPPPSAKPFDPGAWPFSEADPATWPPFSPAL